MKIRIVSNVASIAALVLGFNLDIARVSAARREQIPASAMNFCRPG